MFGHVLWISQISGRGGPAPPASPASPALALPQDTVRRHIQLQAGAHVAWQAAAASILRDEGLRGMYRGFIPNTLKNLPNKGAPARLRPARPRASVASSPAWVELISLSGLCPAELPFILHPYQDLAGTLVPRCSGPRGRRYQAPGSCPLFFPLLPIFVTLLEP